MGIDLGNAGCYTKPGWMRPRMGYFKANQSKYIAGCLLLKVMKTMKFTSVTAQVILLLLLVIASTGCEKSSFSPTPTPDVNKLNFQDLETKQHFDSLNQCFNNIIDKSWTAIPYQLNGNFYRSTWCHGSGATSDCRMASSTEDNLDQHILSLYTLTYPQDLSTAFGIGIEALWVPTKTGWGALFSFSENGDGIIGDYWGVRFKKYPPATNQIESTSALSLYDQYQIQETLVGYSFDLPLRDDLALYLKSAEAMRARRLEQIQALAQKVKTTIETHQATICDLEPYQGNGIPPKCTPRSLTAKEENDELAKAENHFSDQKQVLNENYQDLYATWMKAFPMDQCWP